MGRNHPQAQGTRAGDLGARAEAPHRRAFFCQAGAAILAVTSARVPVGAAVAAPGGHAPEKRPAKKPNKKEPTIEDRVFDLAARRFKLDRKKVTRDTSIERRLKNDWTGSLRFLEDLQREFHLKISLKAFRTLRTLGQAADYIERATRKNKPPDTDSAPRGSAGAIP